MVKMIPKPKHLGTDYAAAFTDSSVVAAYQFRPPYHGGLYKFLVSLIPEIAPRRILDLGCGTGDIARGLAPLVEQVDAVDVSPGMIAEGQQSVGGDHPRLRWILGPAEEARFAGPYGLITAGDSLHWLDWQIVFPRLIENLVSNGVLALVTRNWGGPAAASKQMGSLFGKYSTNQDYQPYDLVEELTKRGLFLLQGEHRFDPYPWSPTVEEYIESRHSQQGFSRERMGQRQAGEFDREMRNLLASLCEEGATECRDGRLQLMTQTGVKWGRPQNPFGETRQ